MDKRFKSEYRWDDKGKLIIDHADIFWTNFRGEEKVDAKTGRVVNNKGQVTFNVYIYNEELAEEMKADGWNIKPLEPRNEGDEILHYIPVEIRWRDKNGDMLNEGLLPKTHLYGTKGDEDLTEMTVGVLQDADISDVGLTIRPRRYNDGHSIKAFMAEGWFVVEESNRGDTYRRKKDNETAGGQFKWLDIEDEVIDVIEDLEKEMDRLSYEGAGEERLESMGEVINALADIYGLYKG